MEISKVSFIERSLQALPPEHQTAREIEAIKNDPRLQEKIGNSVYEIQKNEAGYLILTDWCQMQVDVSYLPREDHICGPLHFALTFNDPV